MVTKWGAPPGGSGESFFDGETLDVEDAAIPLTAGEYLGATHATLECQVAPMRYFDDGRTPTAGSGNLLAPGDIAYLDSPDQIKTFRVIAQSAFGVLVCSYGLGN